MKKLDNEKEMVKKALEIGAKYAQARGVAKFEASDSVTARLEYIYRLLVHDKLLQPMPENQVSQASIKHRLALWAASKV